VKLKKKHPIVNNNQINNEPDATKKQFRLEPKVRPIFDRNRNFSYFQPKLATS
jgi:hypothetical protein